MLAGILKIVIGRTPYTRKMIGRKKTYGTNTITEFFLRNKREKNCREKDFVDKTINTFINVLYIPQLSAIFK